MYLSICNELELEQTPGVGEGQGGLAYCSPWGRKESDTAGQLNNTFAGQNLESTEKYRDYRKQSG